MNDPADALGALLRGAEWVGKGHATSDGEQDTASARRPGRAVLDAVNEDDLDDMLAEEKADDQDEEPTDPHSIAATTSAEEPDAEVERR